MADTRALAAFLARVEMNLRLILGDQPHQLSFGGGGAPDREVFCLQSGAVVVRRATSDPDDPYWFLAPGVPERQVARVAHNFAFSLALGLHEKQPLPGIYQRIVDCRASQGLLEDDDPED